MTSSPLYNLSAPMPNGSEFKFSDTKNKVLLIVNVASKCGFTPQYEGLEKIWQKYKEKDFLIIAFPSNNFGQQEPGTDAEVASFCKLNYGVTFPIMKKCDVNGDTASEVYKFLKEEKSGLLGLTRIKWNFEKFLVDRNGHVRYRHASTTKPEALEKEIEELLNESAKA
ncbi:uncharacterized protein MELLADRAFT_53410 [Melampsora larici-populina 98AG31]|uniref:Glutathione peroxidase n=1 Tax=Melampsora larici-populina (strain 98AG31 / pathotype 3-4-7) TaxID=747676 RepID=F4RYY7_MELLP|nr:uncharacterized protein MELLADRAFT_53410 [Melampsora larici-populina 98AG31]EGG02328.1 hypothetical protein MELLADRAFT_53410 [Melampsora larici-populina 98AG31]